MAGGRKKIILDDREEYPGEFDEAMEALRNVREIAVGYVGEDSQAVAYIDQAIKSGRLSIIRRVLKEHE